MNRKKMMSSNRIILATKLVIVSLLVVTFIWATNLIFYSVSSQSNNEQLKGGDMSIKEKVQSLIQTLEDKNLRENSPEKVTKAIQQIGKLKRAEVISASNATPASDATPALIDLLDFKKEIERSNNSDVISEPRLITPEESYPAIETLFIIGKPALPYLAKVVEENEPESIKSKNALIAITYIFREDLSKGIEFLEQSKTNSTTTKGKIRFDKSIEKMKAKYLQQKN